MDESSHPTPIIVRFAPSPTGHIHIGGIRTALYNWLYARHKGGKFLLRIEDTDRVRSTSESEQSILNNLRWLGIDWDDKPIRQSERSRRYREILDQLLSSGHAYRCTCTRERLKNLRALQTENKQKIAYDGHCRELNIDHDDPRPRVVRLKTPTSGSIEISDTLRGLLRVANSELDDMILARTDGGATYQLGAIVDDIDSGITHIIRGDDHLNNSLRQAHLFRALGVIPPKFTHLPLILNSKGEKYSKRATNANLEHHRHQGIAPDALLNYLLRLGWSHGDQEFFTRADMIRLFDLSGLNRSSCRFDPDKLAWLNRQHLKNAPHSLLSRWLLDCFRHQRQHPAPVGHSGSKFPAIGPHAQTVFGRANEDRIEPAILDVTRKKADNLIDQINLLAPLVQKIDSRVDNEASTLNRVQLKTLQSRLAELIQNDSWDIDSLSQTIQSLCHTLNLKMPQLARPLRVVLLGAPSRLGLSDILLALGAKETMARIQLILSELERSEPDSPTTYRCHKS